MRSMSLAKVAASIGAGALDADLAARVIERVSTDSRTTRPGDLFCAIAGERFDGHDFVGAALNAGAAAAVVRRDFPGDGPLVRVADTRRALGDFAAWYRHSCQVVVVGVTGSVGKTSAREAIHAVLGRWWPGTRSEKNFNNEIGVPLSLLGLEPEHRFAVIEMGASRPGEIARLATIAKPQIAVVTTIGAAHLEGFGNIDGVARAKFELVESLGKTGTAVLNADDDRLWAIGQTVPCRVIWFGTVDREHPPGQPFVRGHGIEPLGETVSLRIDHGPRITIHAAGRHQVYAALAAGAVARSLGLDADEIAAGLEGYRTPPMRCQVERLGKVTLINDAYNANPQSMWAALDLLDHWTNGGRRVLVCGDMKELGPSGPPFHEQLGEEIARRRSIDCCVAVGSLSSAVVDAARRAGMNADAIVHCESAAEATELLEQALRDDDVVLVKGSRALHLEQIVERLREKLAGRTADRSDRTKRAA